MDQTLEEVEEQISEIGSKVYHDKIMHERSVDMGSLMKGVFGSSKPANRYSISSHCALWLYKCGLLQLQ